MKQILQKNYVSFIIKYLNAKILLKNEYKNLILLKIKNFHLNNNDKLIHIINKKLYSYIEYSFQNFFIQ